MLLYNQLENSLNYSVMTCSLCFYSKDKATNFDIDIANDDAFKSFEHNTKLVGSSAAANGILENSAIVVLLKYLSNF